MHMTAKNVQKNCVSSMYVCVSVIDLCACACLDYDKLSIIDRCASVCTVIVNGSVAIAYQKAIIPQIPVQH